LLAGSIFLTLPRLMAQGESRFKIIVHRDNATQTLSRKQVSNFFLKKVVSWDDGTAVMPTDLPPRSPVREAFSSAVHRRDVRSILSFWQRQVFSGRNTPPPEAANDEAVLATVRNNRGGIGYVSAQADTRDVRVLRIPDLERQ